MVIKINKNVSSVSQCNYLTRSTPYAFFGPIWVRMYLYCVKRVKKVRKIYLKIILLLM